MEPAVALVCLPSDAVSGRASARCGCLCSIIRSSSIKRCRIRTVCRKACWGWCMCLRATRQRAQNNFVIAHELLHTVGATDKYDANGQPLNPTGLADPNSQPPYPQYKAEIMGGRVALTPNRAEIPKGLEEAVVGYATAAEIGWNADHCSDELHAASKTRSVALLSLS